MGQITYETPGFTRRLIFENKALIGAVYQEREAVQTGMIFLGRVEAYHHNIKGYFVDLGDQKGIYQGQENLHIGKHYLFEVRKVQRGKHAVLSRKVSLIGKHVVYRPSKETEVSKSLPEEERQYLLNQGFEHVYIKRSASGVSLFRLKEEAKALQETYEGFLNIEQFQRRARLLYKPSTEEGKLELSTLYELEETLFRLRQKVVFHEDLQFFIEVTKIGLVIDVNSARYKGDAKAMNDMAMLFISDLLIRMNVGGVVLVDLIGHGEHQFFHDLMKKDPRITSVNISKAGILEIIRKREGINLYDLSVLEMLADLIKLKIEKQDQEVTSLEVNEQFLGLEEYLPQYPISYGKIFGWFKLR